MTKKEKVEVPETVDVKSVVEEVDESVACYWVSDESPKPQVKVEQRCSMKEAKKWLKKQKPTGHWNPRI
mgnify:CR=1 FL=1